MDANKQAETFAKVWVEAWNAHDLGKIISFYAEDVEFTSPNVARNMGEPSGVLRGVQKVQAYFKKGLELNPDLRFDLQQVLKGVHSITLCYHNHLNDKMGAEVMFFDGRGKVNRVYVHYVE